MKKLIALFLIPVFYSVNLNAQNVQYVDSNDIKNIAKDSNFTLLNTFGIWCEPCLKHLDNGLQIENKFENVKMYFVIIDPEKSKFTQRAIDYLYAKDPNIKILILKDEYYGSKSKVKNRKFLKDFTPADTELIEDMSKYILLDKRAEVLAITSYKDYLPTESWEDDSGKLQRRIYPFLQ